LRAGGKGLKEADEVDYDSVTRMENAQPTADEVTDFFDAEPDHE
jgi:hypothetical protein